MSTASKRNQLRARARKVLATWPGNGNVSKQVEALLGSGGDTLSDDQILEELRALEKSGMAHTEVLADVDDPVWDKEEYGSLRQIVDQLQSCGFRSEAGPLERNVAFEQLQELAARLGHADLNSIGPTVKPSPSTRPRRSAKGLRLRSRNIPR